MYQPTREEFQALAQRGNLVPVYRELPADLETPVSVYLKLRGQGESFLLESVEGGEQLARYSFIGAQPSRVFTLRGNQVEVRNHASPPALLDRREGRAGGEASDPLEPLRAYLNQYCAVPVPGLPRFIGGAVGFLSYDIVRHFERIRTGAPRAWTCRPGGRECRRGRTRSA